MAPLDKYNVTGAQFRVVLEADTEDGFSGDVAVDDVRVDDAHCPDGDKYALCGFEGQLRLETLPM